MSSSSLNYKHNSKYPSKRVNTGQVNKLLKFSAWFLIVISALAILFGIPYLIDGLLHGDEGGWRRLGVAVGLIALLTATPIFFACICALRYIYGKNNGKLTMCLFWGIAPYMVYVFLFNFQGISILMMAILPDVLLLTGCYLEYKTGNCVRI